MNSTGAHKELFSAFEPVNNQSWKKQILHDLKAATLEEKQALYEQKMIWRPEPNISIQPFYTREDIQPLPLPALPITQAGWLTQERITYTDEKTANQQAREALIQGASALDFDVSAADISSINLALLLQGIKLTDTPVSFTLRQLPGEFIPNLQTLAPYQWKGSLNYDPLTQTDRDISGIEALAKAFDQTGPFPDFYTLTVNSASFQKAGATVTQEMAYLLAAFVEYAHQLTERGIEAEVIFNKTLFSVDIGTSFFMEIAKLRALQVLYAQLAAAYGVSTPRLFIQAKVAFPQNPEEDPYNNLIRSSLAAMAAILGGSRALQIMPYNGQAEDTFARRMARNISLILKEESYFAQVANIPDGSYYIESLTYMLAQEAWRLFTDIEAEGGYLQARNNGLEPGLHQFKD
jgi:methylmalonyl-CoA mutase